jgi:uncharacterized protein YndB with AHSA1/START domain
MTRLDISTLGDCEIRIERVFDATRERLWRAHTDPELVAQWWGRGRRTVVEHMNVVPGGRWRFVVEGVHGVHGFEGEYREVTPPERLVYTFKWDGMPDSVAVDTLTFEDVGDGRTKLVTVARFASAAERDGALKSGMEQGVVDSYAALDAVLAALRSP